MGQEMDIDGWRRERKASARQGTAPTMAKSTPCKAPRHRSE